jgi:hypothetical protein
MAVTRISTVNELKQIFTEMLINKSSKITKVSNQSVLNGIAFGVAKVAQKALKDIAIVESRLFPDSAFGISLDVVADNYGIASRFGAGESSTYVRVVAVSGTTYIAGTHVWSGAGENFDLEEDLTIGSEGYGYAKVRSQDTGVKTNVAALEINSVTPIPTGHKYTINEYGAMYGRDSESDQMLRLRIRNAGNLAARGTLAYITQTFNKINSNILQVRYNGINTSGQPELAVVTQNGIDLTTPEIDELISRAEEYLSLTELNPLTGIPNISIINIQYEHIDISFRCQLNASANPDEVREELQIAISKYLDFRVWDSGSVFEWDDVLQLVKDNDDVQYVPDTFFYPNSDITTDPTKLPRVRGFLMLDMDGNIITSSSISTLNPIYYPVDADFSFQATVLASI